MRSSNRKFKSLSSCALGHLLVSKKLHGMPWEVVSYVQLLLLGNQPTSGCWATQHGRQPHFVATMAVAYFDPPRARSGGSPYGNGGAHIPQMLPQVVSWRWYQSSAKFAAFFFRNWSESFHRKLFSLTILLTEWAAPVVLSTEWGTDHGLQVKRGFGWILLDRIIARPT